MKLVITIDDDIFDDYLKQGATLPKYGTAIDSLYKALWNGTPLPKNHGDLKDTEKLKKSFITWSKAVQGSFTDADIASIIYNSPTIIKADKEEENEADS